MAILSHPGHNNNHLKSSFKVDSPGVRDPRGFVSSTVQGVAMGPNNMTVNWSCESLDLWWIVPLYFVNLDFGVDTETLC